MQDLSMVQGPFPVAHGCNSGPRDGIPTRFSNRDGSNQSSLGFFTTDVLYSFHGKSGGTPYSSTGLRMLGRSGPFNDRAFDRHVVTHGAPYVTPNGAGRSEGCPAMELLRAERLLPLLSNGGAVFIYSPNDPTWRAQDPWLDH